MDRKVICFIQAFDCENTIAETMESVLNQTYDNWLCFVLSNGNRNTLAAPNYSFDVIKGVAARDRRFVVLSKKYNQIDMYIPSLYYLAKLFPDSYICSLDADDIYEKNFFERAVSFAEKERLDIVACGTRIVLKKNEEADEERLLNKREIDRDLIIQGEDFAKKLSVYRSYFNEMWGKLYRAELFSDITDGWKYAKKYFFKRFLPDTLFTFDNLSRSRRIGILSGTSHKFYQFEQRKVSNATLSTNALVANRHWDTGIRKLIPQKSKFDVYHTYGAVMRFLQSHGDMTRESYEYMQAVLVGWFWDYYSRTLLLTTNEQMLAGHCRRLVMHPKFGRLMRYRDSGRYDNLRNYQSRIEFCRLLRNTLAYQPMIRNRESGDYRNLFCSEKTKREIESIIQKLDETIKELEALRV